jgi:hypothetical protein
MSVTLNSTIKQVKSLTSSVIMGTNDDWSASTKVYPAGIWLYNTDEQLLKVTDGINTYENLDYVLDMNLTTMPLFSYIYHDASGGLGVSWVDSMQWSWHSGNIFTAAYNLLLEEYTSAEAVSSSDTIGEVTIPYKLTPNGYKIVDATNANLVQQVFTNTGTAWYYIIDTTNVYFKLPRNSNFATGMKATEVSGVYNEYKMASGAGQTIKAVKQHLYFFLGNSIFNKSVIDLAAVTDELNNINSKIESVANLDLSAYATISALNEVKTTADNAMPKSGGSFTGGVFENIVALSGNAINCAQGNHFSKTVTSNITFSFSGVPSGKGACVSLVLTNGGNYTVTWPTNLKWAEGTPPELTSSGTDVLTFMTIDGGTTWYGSLSITAAA